MAKQFGKGVELQIGNSTDGASTTYTAVAHVLDTLSGPDYSVDEKEDTDHQNSTNFKQFVPGLVDGGQISCKIGWDPAETIHQTLISLATNRQTRDWRVVSPAPSGAYFQFTGFPSEVGHEFPYADFMAANLTIKVSSSITFEANP